MGGVSCRRRCPRGRPGLRLAGADDFEQGPRPCTPTVGGGHYRGGFSLTPFSTATSWPSAARCGRRRLAAPRRHREPFLAEDAAGRLVGFIHVVFDRGSRDGGASSTTCNVAQRPTAYRDRFAAVEPCRRSGSRSGEAGGIYLWVLEQNTAAQGFYPRGGRHLRGGRAIVGTAPVETPPA